MLTGGETWWERTPPKAKKDFVQEQTQSMGNNGGEEEELMKMWEECEEWKCESDMKGKKRLGTGGGGGNRINHFN